MGDEVSRILRESMTGGAFADAGGDGLVDEESFDEAGYLRINSDVIEAIKRGETPSGYQHYISYGLREGRVLPGTPMEPRNRLLQTAMRAGAGPRPQVHIRYAIESLIVSPSGGLMIVGWVDDSGDPINCIRILGSRWRVLMDGARLVRLRRYDVEEALGGSTQQPFGFFGFLSFDERIDASGPCTVEIWLHGEASVTLQVLPRLVDDLELRNVGLTYLAGGAFFGNAAVEGVACLDKGFGKEMVRFNKAITTRTVASPYVERFGAPSRSPQGSIIVCLYGKSEFLFVQNCLFAGLPGIEDYEFIYVSNSPEMAETLLREARSTSLIYGLPQTVVVLPGNAGFGGANNAAAKVARSRRIMAVNPDVFPRDRDWAKKHTDLIAAGPPDRTRIFGVPLYYDDGSLMHGGMYFDIDVGLSLADRLPRSYRMGRVEHYGKGAPNWAAQYTRPRPVPAVTGAFISTERSWFEKLDGFTEDYVFGHYEDADLCLKSIKEGTLPWLQDLRMWHLEGKGSTRLPPHEGGSLVNRWLFSKTWCATIEAGLRGPAPSHPGFEVTSPLAGGPLAETSSSPAPSPVTTAPLPARSAARSSGRAVGSQVPRATGRVRTAP